MTRFILGLIAVLFASLVFAQDEAIPSTEVPGLTEALFSTLPLILAAIVPPVVRILRTTVGSAVPREYLPVAIPLLAGLTTGVANLFGLDVGMSATELQGASIPVWESVLTGFLIGLGGIGIHQIKSLSIDKKGVVPPATDDKPVA